MAAEDTAPPSFLLLLPPAPSPSSYASLKTTYGVTLSDVLKEVANASQESTAAAVLEIALACPHLAGKEAEPRDATFPATQSLVAGLYKLIAIIAAKSHINIEDSDGVDVRVLLVAWSPESTSPATTTPFGPVIDLPTLAASQRPWQYAFGVESDQGEAFVRAFVAAKQGHSHAQHSHGASGATQSLPGPVNDAANVSIKRHTSVAVGGTFDHIHLGHKLLLTITAFAVDQQPVATASGNRTIVVGITGDELLKNKKYAEYLESWHERQQSVFRFLSALIDFTPLGAEHPRIEEIKNDGPNGHSVNITFSSGLAIKCVEIWDPFGPTITEESISALIISAETRSGGKAVNDKRAENGWSALQVLEVDVLDPEESSEDSSTKATDDFQSKLSSTDVRRKLSSKRGAVL